MKYDQTATLSFGTLHHFNILVFRDIEARGFGVSRKLSLSVN